MTHRIIRTETPIKAIWHWLGRLSSLEVAKGFLQKWPPDNPLSDIEREERIKSLSFAIREARDYFHPNPDQNLTESCLSYYYGLMSLLSALIITEASPAHSLSAIEEVTRLGHGLNNLSDPTVKFPHSELVHFVDRGFMKLYDSAVEMNFSQFFHDRRVRTRTELPRPEMAISIFDLVVRVPELMKSSNELWEGSISCLRAMYLGSISDPNMVTLVFSEEDNIPNLTLETVLRVVPELRREWMKQLPPNDIYATPRVECWIPRQDWERLPTLYNSPLIGNSYVEPVHSTRFEMLIIHFLLLYLLSIFVRYRPNLWRRIMEGDLDWFRPLMAEYLLVVERVVPNLVLNALYIEDFSFKPLI